AAARQVGLDDDPTGRLFGQDDRLRAGLPPIDLDLCAVGTRLIAYGVTGVTDAPPTTDPGALAILATAIDRGDLPHRVLVTGERGDQYLTDVDPDDLDHLYPCGGLIAAGVPVGGGTDAPFGDPDPWRAIAAAVTRTTERGHVLGRDERIPPRRALDLFLTPPD